MKALFTRRLGAVTLLSLSSGLPLGLVITALPAWLAVANVDIKTIGLLTLTQLPYGFKFVWSPLLDRARPPFLTGRRGWILFCQLALAAVVGALAWLAGGLTTCATPDACKGLAAPSPEIVTAIAALSFLISFASASQDIVYDAYAVEVLEKHEHGTAVGARDGACRLRPDQLHATQRRAPAGRDGCGADPDGPRRPHRLNPSTPVGRRTRRGAPAADCAQ